MRTTLRLAIPVLGAIFLMAGCGPGYSSGGVAISAQAGNGVDVYGYSSDYYGDWHTSYRNWSPTVVYESNGTYYPNRVRGAREVQVYKTDKGYVMPPRDADWAKTDKRFSSKRVPNDADYQRARPHPGS